MEPRHLKKIIRHFACVILLLFGCKSEGRIDGVGTETGDESNGDLDSDADTDSDIDGDTDTDNDTDTDADTDIDTDSDTDSDSDTDTDADTDVDTGTDHVDQDGDGWIEGIDCDDANPDVNQGESEIYDPPNGVDEDCDGLTDEEPAAPDNVSYIWIANSDQGSVSKIDTRTMVELGRYWVKEDHGGSPSRTSVNLDGDMAVAARNGGISKFFATSDRCQDTNGTAGIQTSSGADDILDWETEECRAWHAPFTFLSMRALAWTTDGNVWASGSNATSTKDETASIDVILLDGDTGSTIHRFTLDTSDAVSGSHGHGGYGAVVDRDNNFWIVQLYEQKLIKVSSSDYSVQTWVQPAIAYGISIDGLGRIWTCNEKVARYDPVLDTWETSDTIAVAPFWNLSGGCMADGQGILWNSIGDTLYAIDTETLTVVDQITTLPAITGPNGEDSYWGVAIDVDGFVWTIPRYGSEAFRINPADATHEKVSGLIGAYTYSDMTGFALGIVDVQ